LLPVGGADVRKAVAARQDDEVMTSTDDVGADEGGESPCLAHLLDEPQRVNPELFAQLVDDVADAVDAADGEGTTTS
jgi:hypothetical protein